MHNRGVDVGHDNAVYVLPQNDSPFLHGKHNIKTDNLM